MMRKFLTVREGLTGPEEAPFAGTTCQKFRFSSSAGGRALVLLISHDKKALAAVIES